MAWRTSPSALFRMASIALSSRSSMSDKRANSTLVPSGASAVFPSPPEDPAWFPSYAGISQPDRLPRHIPSLRGNGDVVEVLGEIVQRHASRLHASPGRDR